MARMREYMLNTLIRTDCPFTQATAGLVELLSENDAVIISTKDEGVKDMEFPIDDQKQAHYFNLVIRLPKDNVGGLNDELALCAYLLTYKLEMKI